MNIKKLIKDEYSPALDTELIEDLADLVGRSVKVNTVIESYEDVVDVIYEIDNDKCAVMFESGLAIEATTKNCLSVAKGERDTLYAV